MADPPVYADQSTENGFYPLHLQEKYFRLPHVLQDVRQESRLPAFATQSLPIICFHRALLYDLDATAKYVNFQYQSQYGLGDFRFIKISQGDSVEEGVGTVSEYYLDDQPPVTTSEHLQCTLNMIFTLAPCAQIKLILCNERTQKLAILQKIAELQDLFPNAIFMSNTAIIESYVFNIYQGYMDGRRYVCKEAGRIDIPMFWAASNQGWIIDGALYALQVRDTNTTNLRIPLYAPLFYTKDHICFVGGVTFQSDNQTLIAHPSTSCGFCPPDICIPTSCAPNLPPYENDYGVNLPLDLRNTFRIANCSHFYGPYNLGLIPGFFMKNGTSYAVLFMAVQYAHMKFYFGDTFLPGEGPFIEKMFARQSTTSQPLFTYIERGQIDLKPGMPRDQMEYLDCANPKYRIRPSIGLNPCGLGVPDWSSTEWL